MALVLKYQGQQKGRNKNEETYKQTYIGTQLQVDAFISGSLPSISTYAAGKGYFTGWRKLNDGGPHYSLELNYSVSHDSFDNTDPAVYGRKSAQLSVRNIQMPLEACPNYKTKWNYYLCGLSGQSLPEWAGSTSTVILTPQQRKNYMWVKSIGQVPTDPNQDGVYWTIMQEPTKPGVEYYDMACFVVTQTAKYSTASQAGQSIAKNINKIVSPSQTFGLSGGNWKLDQASIAYTGKCWAATTVHTKSGDNKGWDTDLYGNN